MAVSIGGASPKEKTAQGTGGMGFIKTGGDAKKMFAEEQAKAEALAEERNKLWRFRIPEEDCGKDFKITFLDGHLDEEGSLAAPMWMEHTAQLAGSWKNVPCTSHEEPCPLCESSNNASLVAGFTVIDHTPFKIKKGPKAGEIVKDQRRLFIAKKTTFGILQKLAAKNGGLVGLTVEVSRTNDKSPNVGDVFMVEEKSKLSQLAAKYGDAATPADFGHEITYYTAKQLIQLGAGKGMAGGTIGGEGPSKDLDAELGLG